MDNNLKREKIFQIFTYFCLALSLVSTVTYMIYKILTITSVTNQLLSIIGVILLAIISILLVIMGMFNRNKKVKIFLIIGSLLLSFFSIFQIITGVIKSKDYVIDFTGMDIKEVVIWAESRNILIEQEFQNSDIYEKYKVISQDIKEGTSTNKIDKIKVIVSDGIDTSVNTEVVNMIGWNLDKVIEFIDNKHLTNVTILFEFSDTVMKDKIISQDVIREIKRDEAITIVSSLGKESELKNVTMDNLVGLDTFHAIVYLGRNNLKYSIEYVYNEDKDEDIVLKQSVKKWEVISPSDDTEIVLTVSKKDKITIPNLSNMSLTDVTTWATNNRLKLETIYQYDDTIKKDKVISYNPIKGSMVDIDSTIKVTISKGPLYMIEFTTVDEFTNWANENNVLYKIDYQYSSSVDKGKLISSSHNKNQVIKNDDTVNLVISQGGNTTIPNLVGMTKKEATSSCSKAKITCKFIYLDNNTNYNIVTKQSIKSGINVPVNTTVTITLGE